MKQSGTLTYNNFDELCEIENNKYSIPYELEIEQEIISILICGQTEHKQIAIEHTTEKMITDNSLKTIYLLILSFIKDNTIQKLDRMSLLLYINDFLKDIKNNDETLENKLISYISFLSDNVFTQSANIKNIVEKLHKAYKNRCEKYINTREGFEALDKELEKVAFKESNLQTLDSLFDDYVNNYENSNFKLIKTGYSSIDFLIGGLQGGNLAILGGNAGMGKTAMGLNIMLKMAENNIKCLFFSLEMSNNELSQRVAAIKTGIKAENIRLKKITDDEWNIFYSFLASKEYETITKNLLFSGKSNLNINEIEKTVRKTNADIVIIDYLGLIKSEKTKNSYEEVSDVSRRLKLLAIETNKPILTLAQLNRNVSTRNDKRPTMADLRDSGKIEQDADFIFFVYRPSYFDSKLDSTELQFLIAKSRHTGGAGQIVNLCFNGATQQIKDRSRLI